MRRLFGLRPLWAMVFAGFAGIVVNGQAAAPVVNAGAQLTERLTAGGWDRFSVRVVVRREWVPTDNAAGGYPPVTDEYLYTREKTTGGWRTRVEVVSSSAATVRTRHGDSLLATDLGVAAMEDDEDGTAPRFFNRAGVALVPPSLARRERWAAGAPPAVDAELLRLAETLPGIRRRAAGHEWLTAFVMPAGEGRMRLERTTRGFGRRTGWVRGYGRYMKASGDRAVELLMDEGNGVPVETNVVERGALRSHTTFAYERAATGALMRRGVRIERAASDSASEPAALRGVRKVTDIGYHDVQLTAKGGR